MRPQTMAHIGFVLESSIVSEMYLKFEALFILRRFPHAYNCLNLADKIVDEINSNISKSTVRYSVILVIWLFDSESMRIPILFPKK